jgi:hypothetical protein
MTRFCPTTKVSRQKVDVGHRPIEVWPVLQSNADSCVSERLSRREQMVSSTNYEKFYDLRVKSIAKRAEEGDVHADTLRRAANRGELVLTQVSPGRVGVRDDHWRQYLDARVRRSKGAA